MTWNRAGARARRGLFGAALATAVLLAATEATSDPTQGGVAPGSRVRWRTPSQGTAWQVGRFAMATGDTLLLLAPGTRDTLAVAGSGLSHFQISRGRKPHWRTGAWIGAATGVGLSLMFMALGSIDEPGAGIGVGEAAYVAFAVGVIGAGAGLGVGGLVRTERWESVPEPWSMSASTERAVFAVKVSRSW